MNFTFIWCSYNRSWSQIFASFIQGQSANSRKDNDLRSVIQSREDALREVEKLVKHAESLERKYNEKVWMAQAISFILPVTLFHYTTFWTSSFYDGIVLFRLPEFTNTVSSRENASRGMFLGDAEIYLCLVCCCFVMCDCSVSFHSIIIVIVYLVIAPIRT